MEVLLQRMYDKPSSQLSFSKGFISDEWSFYNDYKVPSWSYCLGFFHIFQIQEFNGSCFVC